MAESSERLSLNQQQKLQQRLSPLQVQYVRMLEMSRAELEDTVRAELDDNPALEIAGADAADDFAPNLDDEGHVFAETAEDIIRADYSDPDDVPYYRLNTNNYSADDDHRESTLTDEKTLMDHLESQLGEKNLSEEQRLVAGYVIGNIDGNGYLQRTPAAIADDIAIQTGVEVPTSKVRDAIALVQSLDPAGVGASNLREALLLQLQRKQPVHGNTVSDAIRILEDHFQEFYKKHYDRMPVLLGVDKERATAAVALIRTLHPKPGNMVGGGTASDISQQIVPDFNVEVEGDTLRLTLLNSIPELQIEQTFSDMNTAFATTSKLNRKEAEAASFVKQKYDAAANFIKILSQTTGTLYRVGAAILKRQREFFLTGDETELKPMVLKDIADDTGLDISVVSRATMAKYINTQWGIFPLKFFFNEGLGSSRGEEASSREIQSILKEVIAGEDKRKPMSDELLCKVLQRHGYDIARRTVAKYRELLNIPVARLRREV